MRSKKFLLMILLFSATKLFANYPVFDQMGWLAAIDRFYQGYDQIMNTLTMIEQNYNQIQSAYERAKSWNFESLDFNDGDILHSIDIRDEIKDAGTQINRELTNIRQIKEAFTNKNITMNGHSYSLKDLAGIGDADRSLLDMASDTAYVMKDSVTEAAAKFAQGVTEEEATLIYQKYGLSPKNFAMVKSIDQMMQKAVQPVFAMAEDSIQDVINSKDIEQYNLVNGIIDKMLNQDGDSLTTAQAMQAATLLSKLTLDQLRTLNRDMRSASAYAAWRDRHGDILEQAKGNERADISNTKEHDKKFMQEIF